MKDKLAKPSADAPANQKAEADRPTQDDLTEKRPRKVGEGSENLRQRSEWFRRRAGDEK
jgi:hypothetical protein